MRDQLYVVNYDSVVVTAALPERERTSKFERKQLDLMSRGDGSRVHTPTPRYPPRGALQPSAACSQMCEASAVTSAVAGNTSRPQQRLSALDQMRGLVMLLMTLDHASEQLNRGRFVTDAAWMWKPGSPIPEAQFVLRWLTHLCAPTFVFLAGVGIALSTAKRRASGESDAELTRSLAVRGLFIAALDPLWMSPVMMEGQGILFQVLFAIGISMLLLSVLRRLPAVWLLALGGVLCLASEACVFWLRSLYQNPWSAMLLTTGRFPMAVGPLKELLIAYPFVPWLAIMLLGYGCASWLAEDDRQGVVGRRVLLAGLGSLALFALVRGLNSYGNMGLLRDNVDFVQWLHVSKYPPSLSYVLLELGCMALVLSLLYRVNRRYQQQALPLPLLGLTILGRAALFYYVLHFHLIALLTWLFGLHQAGEILAAIGGSVTVVLLLSVPVARYQRYKTAHPNGWVRYL